MLKRYDRNWIDPPAEQLHNAILTAIRIANKRGRYRRLPTHSHGAVQQYTTRPWGVINGKGTPYSSSSRSMTSRLGVAWFTDELDRKHVRVVSDRVGAGFRRHTIFFYEEPLERRAIESVYPELAVRPWQLSSQSNREEQALCAACLENIFDLSSWCALADRYEDHPDYLRAADARKAAERVQTILTPTKEDTNAMQ